MKELYKLVQKYDSDKSGNLNAEELKSLIEHYAAGSEQVHSDPPTESELSWILQAAGKHKANSVDASEIEFALDLWHSYVKNRAKIEAVFDKYDTNHSQRLEVDQLKLYLTELNEGHAPKVIALPFCAVHQRRCIARTCALKLQDYFRRTRRSSR